MNRVLTVGFVLSGLAHVGLFAAMPPQTPPAVSSAPTREIVVQLMRSRPAVAAVTEVRPDPRPDVATEPGSQVIVEPETYEVAATEPSPAPTVQPEPRRGPPPEIVASSKGPEKNPPRPAQRPVKPAEVSRLKRERGTAKAGTSAPEPPPEQLTGNTPRQPEAPVVTIVEPGVRQDYLAALTSKIQQSKFYPRSARRRGEQGRVVVSFVIRRDGELQDISVRESSGYRRLDEAALKTLRRVSPFKPIPDVLSRDQWAISVPIAFNLRG